MQDIVNACNEGKWAETGNKLSARWLSHRWFLLPVDLGKTKGFSLLEISESTEGASTSNIAFILNTQSTKMPLSTGDGQVHLFVYH